MIDKMWYEWQGRNPASAKSFFGGSVQHLDNEADYLQYPSGGPPYLSVSFYFAHLNWGRFHLDFRSHSLNRSFRPMDCSRK